VAHLAGEAGIGQFIDIGSGLPTQHNVHEVAQQAAPDARVVYVDHDPVVLVHGQALLQGINTTFLRGDLLEPQQILTHPDLTDLIDFDQPVAILLVAILHFVPDTAVADIIARLRAVMAPGSYLVISHIVDDPSTWAIGEIMRAAGAPAWYPRTRTEIARFFDGFHFIDPGLTSVEQWHPAGPDVIHIPAPAGPGGEMWCDAGVAQLLPGEAER
jgi:O-methyltransferase involved in polyketide biosynthesis